MCRLLLSFFFNDTATTEIYTLSLHDALPISTAEPPGASWSRGRPPAPVTTTPPSRAISSSAWGRGRSEEHTSELQSQFHLVCRLLLEKKKKKKKLMKINRIK